MTQRVPLPGPHKWQDDLGNRYIDGYLYMGPTGRPVLPPRTALYDSANDKYQVLSQTADVSALLLVDISPAWKDVQKYTDGVIIDGWRVLLNAGALYTVPAAAGITDRPVYTRKGSIRSVLKLTVDASGTIVYTPVSL